MTSSNYVRRGWFSDLGKCLQCGKQVEKSSRQYCSAECRKQGIIEKTRRPRDLGMNGAEAYLYLERMVRNEHAMPWEKRDRG